MAEYLAGKEVKHRLWASGIKVNQVAMSEIRHLARGYIAEHPEIVEKAKSWCEDLHQQELVKRERQRQRRLIQKTSLQPQLKSPTTPMADNLASGYSEIDR
jgi:hypothetical protein